MKSTSTSTYTNKYWQKRDLLYILLCNFSLHLICCEQLSMPTRSFNGCIVFPTILSFLIIFFSYTTFLLACLGILDAVFLLLLFSFCWWYSEWPGWLYTFIVLTFFWLLLICHMDLWNFPTRLCAEDAEDLRNIRLVGNQGMPVKQQFFFLDSNFWFMKPQRITA